MSSEVIGVDEGQKKNVKTDDKIDIELEEKKLLNGDNKTVEDDEDGLNPKEEKAQVPPLKSKTADRQEGMEVKPKKIPIGGIQMPGFFTRSKSKEKCKDDEQEEGTELIHHSGPKTESSTGGYHFYPQRIKLPINPFRNSKLFGGRSTTTTATDPECTVDGTTEEKDTTTTNNEPPQSVKEKRNFFDTIRLPLGSVFPRIRVGFSKETDQNLEQTQQAGLASMETLDDEKSTTDENNMKTVPLDDNESRKSSQKIDVEAQFCQKFNNYWKDKITAYRMLLLVFMSLFLLIILIVTLTFPPPPPLIVEVPLIDDKYMTTVTSCGPVQGILEDGSVIFRGIPYARPPVKELRFKRAQPINDLKYCWSGKLIAEVPTEHCMQLTANGTVTGIEDCLTMDIVTPVIRYDTPLPVVVLIGADSLTGGSPGRLRPSARLARTREVLFVRPNFRLGVLGFLATKALSNSVYPPSSGNYALSDLLVALEWIQLNIRHFGGNESNVILLGHRAGATLVTALATVKSHQRMYSKIWLSSGSAIYPRQTLPEAERRFQTFPDLIGCTNYSDPNAELTCLRQMDAAQLVSAIEGTWRKVPADLPDPLEIPEQRHEWLVMDGVMLREHPAEVWSRDDFAVTIVIGSTAQSGINVILADKHVNWTADLVQDHIEQSLIAKRNLTYGILERYPMDFRGLVTMVSDIRIVCPLFAIATQIQGAIFYVVTMGRHADNMADIDSDIDAILGRYEPITPAQKRYNNEIQTHFYAYTWQGVMRPKDSSKVLEFDQNVNEKATYSACDFWINNNIVLPYAALD